MVNWLPLKDTQIRTSTDARQYYELLAIAEAKLAEYPGWLFWKTYPNGREYLVHAFDRTGRGTTRGARDAESEAFFNDFKNAQDEARSRVKLARETLQNHGRFCKAARINRFPRPGTKVVRGFAEAGWQKNFLIVGTYALYVYESLADVQFLSGVLETADLDLLWDAEEPLKVIVKGDSQDVNPEDGALGILKRVDKSYTRNEEKTFQAINASGYVVDFLRPLIPMEPPLIGKDDRLNPIALTGLDWLVESALDVMVIDIDGIPMMVRVPDPRIFAAHKWWLSEKTDRNPGKRDRDAQQAKTVASLLLERRPVLPALTAPQALNPALDKLGLLPLLNS